MAQRALARRQSPEGWPPEYLVSSRERRVESERGAVSEVTAEGREADSAARYRYGIYSSKINVYDTKRTSLPLPLIVRC